MKNNDTFRPYVQGIGTLDVNSTFFPPYTEVRSAAGIHIARHMKRDRVTNKAIVVEPCCWSGRREYKHAAPACDIKMQWDLETHIFISAECACGRKWASDNTREAELELGAKTLQHLKETQ